MIRLYNRATVSARSFCFVLRRPVGFCPSRQIYEERTDLVRTHLLIKPDIFRIIEEDELFPLSVHQRLKNQRETYQEQKTILRILGRKR